MITYNDTALDDFADVTLSVSRTADPAPPETPTHFVETYTLGAKIYQSTSAQVWDRVRNLQALSQVTEGTLVFTDETGATDTVEAEFISDNTAEVISHGKGELQLVFRAKRPVDALFNANLSATYLPNAGTAITLPHISGWAPQVQEDRYHQDKKPRSRCRVTIDFTATPFIAAADSGSRTDRRDAATTAINNLITQLTERAEGVLTFGNFSQTVRITSAKPVMDADGYTVSLSLQATYTTFPNGSVAEADYQEQTGEDCETGETTLNISGEIQARTKEEAIAKLDEIRTEYRTETNQLRKEEKTHRWVRGEDDDTDATWLEMNFSLEFRDQKENHVGYTLAIDTREDLESGEAITTYSGQVKAPTLALAQAKAHEVGLNQLPSLLKLNETTEYATDCDGSQKFQGMSFSYEYQTDAASRSGILGGQIRMDTARPTHGDHTVTVSGTITGGTYQACLTKARTYKPTGLIREENETQNQKIVNATSQAGVIDPTGFTSLDFSYTALIKKTVFTPIALRYTKATEPDYEALTERVTYSGSAFAGTATLAEEAILNLGSALGPSSAIDRKSLSERIETKGATSYYLGTDFTISYIKDIEGAIGYDILSASYELKRTPMVQRSSITPVLFAAPVVQANLGWTEGSMELSARCSARTKAAALSWGQSLETLVSSVNGVPGVAQPGNGVETLSPQFKEKDPRLSAATALTTEPARYDYQVSFKYAYGRSPGNETPIVGLMTA